MKNEIENWVGRNEMLDKLDCTLIVYKIHVNGTYIFE